MLSPFPIGSPVTKAKFLISEVWSRWLTGLVNAVNNAAQRRAAVDLENQGAATPTTTALMVASTGLYRLAYALRVTQAATSSSSATVTFHWTDGRTALSQAQPAVNGNTTTTQQNDSLLIGADASTAITYSIAYASSGATPMQYGFRLSVEQLP